MKKTYNTTLAKPALFLAVALLTLLISACGSKKDSEPTKLIPKGTLLVFKIDVKQLTSKTISLDKLASEENLQQMGASKEEAQKNSKAIKKFLDSGIDFLNKFYLFTDEIKDRNSNFGLAFTLDNEDKFTKFIKNDNVWKDSQSGKKPEFKEEGKIKFAIFEDKRTILAWQGKTGLVLSKDNNSTAELKKLFEMKKEESLAENESFKDFLSKGYDVSIWVDLEKASNLGGMQATAAMGAAGISNKNTYFDIGLTFEKGVVNVDIDYTGNEEINKLNDKIANSAISSELTKNIPIATPSTGFSFSLNFAGLLNYLKERGVIGELKQNLKQFGITPEELGNALTGDAFGATQAVNFNAKQGEIPVEFVLVLGIKDKKSAEDILEKLNQKTGGMLTKEGDVYAAPQGMGYVIVKDKAAYITLDGKLKDGIKAGKSDLKGDLKNEAEKYASVIYVGKGFFDALTQFEGYQREAIGQAFGKDFPFESVVFKSEKMKNKKSKSVLSVSFTNKNQNALLTLIDISKKVGEAAEKQRKQIEEEFKMPDEVEEQVLEDQEEKVLEEK